MAKRVLARDESGGEAIVAYDETPEERAERIEQAGLAARSALRLTPGQARHYRRVVAATRRGA